MVVRILAFALSTFLVLTAATRVGGFTTVVNAFAAAISG